MERSISESSSAEPKLIKEDVFNHLLEVRKECREGQNETHAIFPRPSEPDKAYIARNMVFEYSVL